ncbi:2-dehydro-3-deoxygalactonokinase [Paracoccus jeotgali]|nr:2-dehydro-3-deoxygalactonokinase [Paracoccus jeotgali]
MTDADWIAAESGPRTLRAWAMRGDDPVETRSLDRREGFEATLAQLLSGWPQVPVIACGMRDPPRDGIDAATRRVPCPALPLPLVTVPEGADGRSLRMVAGITQADPPDLICGDETRLAGLLLAAPDFDGVVCLPGHHTRWVRVSAGEICHVQTVMTSDILQALSQETALRFSLLGQDNAFDETAFDEALDLSLSRPHAAWGRLFRLRVEAMTENANPGHVAGWLAGLVIGLDLGASRAMWLGQKVLILGADALAPHYHRALDRQGVGPLKGDATAATLAGLSEAWRKVRQMN